MLEKRVSNILAKDDMRFVFISGKDAVFILWSMYDVYLAKQKKLYICLEDAVNTSNIVPRKDVERALT